MIGPRNGLRRRGRVLAVLLCTAGPALAQSAEELPEELEGIGITEHLDAQVPLEDPFVDEHGEATTLGRYLDGRKPVILNLGYFRCPMLCGLVLNGLVQGLKEVAWSPGVEFEVITVSIDPTEGPELAARKKDSVLRALERPSATVGWHFLTGAEPAIRAVAETVGFKYGYNEEREEYVHTAALFVLTPEGRVSRYLYGIEFEPRTLRLALTEASEGKLGSTLDRFILQCFYYDAEAGRYAPAARRIMSLAGVVTLALLGWVLLLYWRRESRRRRASESGSQP